MTKLDTFQALIADLGQATIDQIQARLDEEHFWDEALSQDVMERAQKSYIRQSLRKLKGVDGRPLWYSILIQEGDATRRAYKQLELFNPEDYRQAITYAVNKAQYWQGQAATLRDELHKRHGEQLPLPWE